MHSYTRLGRLGALILIVAAFVVTPQVAGAQTFTWVPPLGGEWMSAGSWTPAGGPPNGVGTTAIFGNVVNNPVMVTIAGGAVTVGDLDIRDLTLLSAAYSIGQPTNTITLNNGDGTGILSVNVSPTLGNMQKIPANLSVAGTFLANIQSGTVQVSGSVSASGGLIKSGNGSLICTTTNPGLTGGIAVNGGSLEVRGSDDLSMSGMGTNAVTVASGGQLVVNATGFWQPTNTLTIAGKGPTGAPQFQDAALWFKGSADYYQGPITLTGDASLRLDGAFLLRGSSNVLTLNGHEARFTGGSSASTVGEVDGVIADGSTASGSVRIDINGGNIKLSADNTYSGATLVNKGTLFIDRPASLGQALGTATDRVAVNSGGVLSMEGSGPYTVNKLLTLGGGTVICNSGNKTWTGAVTLTANSTITAEGSAGHFMLSGGINLNGNTLTLRPTFGDSIITIDTVGISGTGGLKIVPVTGQGTINLNATSTYSGTTMIQSHKVYANATQSTGTGAVTVSGGSLRGVGSVTGAVTVSSGSIFPGAPTTPGNLTLNGGVTFASSTQFQVRVVSNTSFDSATVAGSAVLGNATLSVDLSGADTNFNVGTDKLYILKMSGVSSLQTGTTFNVPNGGAVGSTSLYTFFAFYDYSPNGGVYLIPQPVPEPSLLIAVAASALGLMRLRRLL